MIIPPGATSISVDVFFADDSGFAVTGKTASDFPACKWSSGTNTADTTITLSDLAAITTAHPNDNTAGGVKEREGGWYRLDIPNNVFTSAGRKTLTFAETTNKRIIAPFLDVQYTQSDLRQANGTAITTTTAGVPVVDVGRINNVATTSVTTVKAVIGLTTADTISALGANTITAASIAAAALNGKGDWGTATTLAAVKTQTDKLQFSLDGMVKSSLEEIQGDNTFISEFTQFLQDYANSLLSVSVSGVNGDLTGKVLGGGAGVLAGAGVWAYRNDGTSAAPAATALSTATWTNARAANLDNLAGVTFPTNFGSLSIDTNGRVKIQSGIPKNAALAAFGFFMCDSSDHVTGKTGLTITATRSLDGAAPAACANSATEVGGGKYKIDLAAADLNGNTVVLTFSGTGADDRIIEIVTTP